MFTIRGSVIKGDNEKKNFMLLISQDDHNKIVTECANLSHVFKNTSVQPIYPTWKHERDGIVRYYAKVLLSKARKEQFDALVNVSEERLWRVMASPYSIENSNTGVCNGISLYYQGEFVAPKKFRMKQEKISPRPNILEHESD